MPTAKHSTITLERQYPVSAERVFAAWADPEERRQWGSPAPDITLQQERAEFAVGKGDISHCIMDGTTIASVHSHYIDIVENRRILYSEAIESEGKFLGASLITAEFAANGSGAHLTVTIQTSGVDGSTLEVEAEGGWTASLDSLGEMMKAAAMA